MNRLVLSLFPGIGLLDMAFEEAGFCVVRGPDFLWGGDVKAFHPPAGKFEGVIGGPPCQAFSRLRHIVIANGYELAENLIPEFERCVSEARPNWYLMENVPDADSPRIDGYVNHVFELKDHWCGGETSRHRKFWFASRPLRILEIKTELLTITEPVRAVTCDARQIPIALGGSGKRKKGLGGTLPRSGPKMSIPEMARLQGVPIEVATRLQEHGAFTASALRIGFGNGVPLAMGRAIAKAVTAATSSNSSTCASEVSPATKGD